ncbi:tyrosine-type recombinase/integrase [Mesorhizobium marinum]|uniref:tyrosine-type recombinase/integrase n=1 Tax=Mesorhizobium marinum TaxID=3228790 RepID=UPI003465DC83
MPRALNKLTDTFIRSKELKAGRHPDGGGLYLRVRGNGSKHWVFLTFKTVAGKRLWKEVGLGAYPTVSLKDARAAAEDCRRQVQKGLPAGAAGKGSQGPTFAQVAADFIDEMGKGWSNQKHRAQWEMTLGDTYCRSIRSKAISEVSTADVLAVLKPIWMAKPETAQRLRGRIERVMSYAKAAGLVSGENPAMWRGHLEHLLSKREKLTRGHHSAMPYADVPSFVERLGSVAGLSGRAIEFLILTAARSGEVLGATWSEIDFESEVWTVPKERMKGRRAHRVPLSPRAVDILRELHDVRTGEYIFPGEPKAGIERPLSVMAFTMQMRRMGVGHYTPHGFRSAFRDWAGDETSFPREVAEAALAHRVGNEVENAYRRSDALEKRRLLMAAWAKFVGTSAKVLSLVPRHASGPT